MIWRETPQTNSMLRTWMSNALECATSHVVLRSTTVSRELIERELCDDMPFLQCCCCWFISSCILILYLICLMRSAEMLVLSFLYSFYGLKFCYSKLTARLKENKNRETLANECLLCVVHWWFEYKPNTFCSQCLFSSSHNHLILLPINKVVLINEFYIKPHFPSNSKNGTSYIIYSVLHAICA